MAITRAAVEAEVVGELGPLLDLAGKAITHAGSNADLAGPIAFALQALGITPADPTAPADADCAGLAATQWPALCGLSQYYALKKCLNSLVIPNEGAQDRRQDWNEMVRRFDGMLGRLAVQYAAYLNLRPNPTVVGVAPSRFPDPRVPATWGVGTGYLDH